VINAERKETHVSLETFIALYAHREPPFAPGRAFMRGRDARMSRGQPKERSMKTFTVLCLIVCMIGGARHSSNAMRRGIYRNTSRRWRSASGRSRIITRWRAPSVICAFVPVRDAVITGSRVGTIFRDCLDRSTRIQRTKTTILVVVILGPWGGLRGGQLGRTSQSRLLM